MAISRAGNGTEWESAVFVKISHPAVARTLCSVGTLNALILDTEHGAFTDGELEVLCSLVSSSGHIPVIRVGQPDPYLVARALDRGAGGVMIPQVQTPQEAETAVRGLHLVPGGRRGWDPTVAANDYGSGAPPRQVRCFVQIETAGAVAAAQELATMPGVTDLFIGPADLSRSLGGDTAIYSSAVIDACTELAQSVSSTARLGLYVDSPQRAEWALSLGFRFLAVGSDVGFLRDGARRSSALPDGEYNF